MQFFQSSVLPSDLTQARNCIPWYFLFIDILAQIAALDIFSNFSVAWSYIEMITVKD